MAESSVAVSWSGGKDSCLALDRAVRQGYAVNALLNFVSQDSKRCCFHGIPRDLMLLQSQSLGIPLVTHPMPDDMKAYESEFKRAVSGMPEIQGMVFGDIYLDEHKEWVERVCGSLGISCIEPLWNESTGVLMEEFIGLGYKAIIVSAKADLFDRSICGRVMDREMLAELKARNICLCGENGEFHTLVVDGPLFNQVISLTATETILVDGFWKHWFLDIKGYQAVVKTGVAA